MADNTTRTPTETNYLPPRSPAENEGHTFAAWFAMIGVMVGVVAFGIGMVVIAWPVMILGIVIVVVGLVGGAILRRAGRGQPLR
jgi:uncharacterized membrane protein